MKNSRLVLGLAFLGITGSASCTPPVPPKLPILLDVDTGRDDAWTLYGAMKERHIVAVIASYGNVPLERTAQNSLDVVSFVGAARHLTLPAVWVGEREPLAPGSPPGLAEIARRATVNRNGLADLTLPLSSLHPANGTESWTEGVAKLLRNQESPIDYIVCGPLTNLSRLVGLLGAKDALKYIPHVIVMGGSFDPDLAVDFNFLADPAAAQNVIDTFGERLTLVPYDETRKLRLTEAEILALVPEEGNPAAAFNRDLMLAHARGWSKEKDHAILLHDPATLIVREKETIVRHEKIRVLQDGPTAGKVVTDPAGTTVQRFVIPPGAETRIRNLILNRFLGLR